MPKLTEEEYNNLKIEIDKLNNEISEKTDNLNAKMIEIQSRGKQIEELTLELEDYKQKISELEKNKVKADMLEKELEGLQNDKKSLIEQNSKVIQDLNSLTSSYDKIAASFEDVKKEKDEFIKSTTAKASLCDDLESKLKDLNDKFYTLSLEKEKILKEKIEFMDKVMAEKVELTDKAALLEAENLQMRDRIKDLKSKARTSGQAALGSSMEIDNLMKQMEEKDKALMKVASKLEGIAKGETGIFGDNATLVIYMKERIPLVTRSLRLVAPSIDFIVENDILPLIMALDDKNLVNIAVPVPNLDDPIIKDFKEKGFNVYNSLNENIFALNVDGGDIAIGVTAGADTKGIHTTIDELITLLNVALMSPFIKSVKI